jgi:hypothetical protein
VCHQTPHLGYSTAKMDMEFSRNHRRATARPLADEGFKLV